MPRLRQRHDPGDARDAPGSWRPRTDSGARKPKRRIPSRGMPLRRGDPLQDAPAVKRRATLSGPPVGLKARRVGQPRARDRRQQDNPCYVRRMLGCRFGLRTLPCDRWATTSASRCWTSANCRFVAVSSCPRLSSTASHARRARRCGPCSTGAVARLPPSWRPSPCSRHRLLVSMQARAFGYGTAPMSCGRSAASSRWSSGSRTL